MEGWGREGLVLTLHNFQFKYAENLQERQQTKVD